MFGDRRILSLRHPDLEITRVANPMKSIVLIGNIYDSAEPEQGNDDILKDIMASAYSMEGFVSRIKRYAGRYALLYKRDKDTVIFQDALALREIYYCTKDNQRKIFEIIGVPFHVHAVPKDVDDEFRRIFLSNILCNRANSDYHLQLILQEPLPEGQPIRQSSAI